MSKSQIQSCSFSSMLKENRLSMDGMNEIFMSTHHLCNHAGTTQHGSAWMGMDGITAKPKPGMFFHSFDAVGSVEHQGCLLALTAMGNGRAQLFEWFWGVPSIEIEVTPDYLRNCVFYTSCAAMNAAYERMGVDHE